MSNNPGRKMSRQQSRNAPRPGGSTDDSSRNRWLMIAAGVVAVTAVTVVLAGLEPAGVLCEIVTEDKADMARVPELTELAERRMAEGQAPRIAYAGASKRMAWPVTASTLTTVAVFLPIVFVEEEAGQLFRDIAIAITFSILLSLFVSVAVIPTILNRLYRFRKNSHWPKRLANRQPASVRMPGRLANILSTARRFTSGMVLR